MIAVLHPVRHSLVHISGQPDLSLITDLFLCNMTQAYQLILSEPGEIIRESLRHRKIHLIGVVDISIIRKSDIQHLAHRPVGIDVIGVRKTDVLPCRFLDPSVSRLTGTAVLLLPDHPHPAVIPEKRLSILTGIVRRAIVNQQDFKIFNLLSKKRRHTGADIGFRLKHWHNK